MRPSCAPFEKPLFIQASSTRRPATQSETLLDHCKLASFVGIRCVLVLRDAKSAHKKSPGCTGNGARRGSRGSQGSDGPVSGGPLRIVLPMPYMSPSVVAASMPCQPAVRTKLPQSRQLGAFSPGSSCIGAPGVGWWPAGIVLDGFQALFPPGVAHGPLLTAHTADDRVIRAWPMGLRVRTTQTKTRFGRADGPTYATSWFQLPCATDHRDLLATHGVVEDISPFPGTQQRAFGMQSHQYARKEEKRARDRD